PSVQPQTQPKRPSPGRPPTESADFMTREYAQSTYPETGLGNGDRDPGLGKGGNAQVPQPAVASPRKPKA
ncbi:MAG: hypothetical protein ABI440_11575, partial [Casimicrobiaceae bacterium]